MIASVSSIPFTCNKNNKKRYGYYSRSELQNVRFRAGTGRESGREMPRVVFTIARPRAPDFAIRSCHRLFFRFAAADKFRRCDGLQPWCHQLVLSWASFFHFCQLLWLTPLMVLSKIQHGLRSQFGRFNHLSPMVVAVAPL